MTAPPDEPARPYQCGVCGYIYDPALHGGVRFEELPHEWICPYCGFGKTVFRPLDPEANNS